MRELTMNELEEVSGAGISDALEYWGAAAAMGPITSWWDFWGTIAALTAFGFSPSSRNSDGWVGVCRGICLSE